MTQRLLFLLFFALCATALQAQIIVHPTAADSTAPKLPPYKGLEIEGETIICPGSMTALKVKGPYVSYTWNTGNTNPVQVVNKPGIYEVTVTTKGGCSLTGSVTVRYAEGPCL
jgi:hypothetical protein